MLALSLMTAAVVIVRRFCDKGLYMLTGGVSPSNINYVSHKKGISVWIKDYVCTHPVKGFPSLDMCRHIRKINILTEEVF